MNKIMVSGNLVDAPSSITLPSGVTMTKFVVAVNSIYKNADGERTTQFMNVIAWRGLAETCTKFLNKGSKVLVCGEAQNRKYQNDKGETKYVFEIVADEIEFLDSKKKEE